MRNLVEMDIIPIMMREAPEVLDLCFFFSISVMTEPFDLQIEISNVRYCHSETNRTRKKELLVSEVIPRCSLARSKIDVAFQCKCKNGQNLVLGLLEAKKSRGVFDHQDTKNAIMQTICYSVVPLAYSLWGVLKTLKFREISSLLVFPTCLYRLWFAKGNGPFGLKLRIEMTDDLGTMKYVLREYLLDYIALYRHLQKGDVQLEANVNPRDWSPMNFDFEEDVEGEKFSQSVSHNLGFLFRAKAKTVHDFVQKCRCTVDFISALPTGDETVLIKYHSAILDIDHKTSSTNMLRMVRELRQMVRELRQKQEIAKLMAQLAKAQLGDATLHSGSSSLKSSSADETETCVIKHPYIGILTCGMNGIESRVIVMVDTGPTLREQMKNVEFRARWKSNPKLRSAFFTDVGMSALNLVELLGLGHEDIRPPNITVNDDGFHLIDFDNCCSATQFSDSPLFSDVEYVSEQLMMISVAQIALVIFELETEEEPTTVWDEWFRGIRAISKVTAKFNQWVGDNGLNDVFTRSRHTDSPDVTAEAGLSLSNPVELKYGRKFMENMLMKILKLETGRMTAGC